MNYSTVGEEVPGRRCVVLMYGRSLNLGGTDTLIVRLANNAVGRGHVAVMNSDPGRLRQLLDKRVTVSSEVTYARFIRSLQTYEHYAIDIVFFDPHILLRTLLYISRYLSGMRVRLTVGIFHPRELYPTNQAGWMHRVMRTVFFRSQAGAWIFMNHACLQSHLDVYGTVPRGVRVLPITIHVPKKSLWVGPTRGTGLKVVSIGRIVPFKAYNWGALNVVKELVESGISVRWKIYGDGADRANLEMAAERIGVSNNLSYEGDLDYAQFASTVTSHDLFVGMGTAVLEASALGVPSIVAIDGLAEECFGFFSEGPGDSIGEMVPGAVVYGIASKIREFATMPYPKRREVGIDCRSRAIELTSTKSALIDAFQESPLFHSRRNRVPITLSAMYVLFTHLRRFWRFVSGRPPLEPYY